MRVIEISRPGGPEVLVAADRPVPIPGHGQVLVQLDWAGVNRPDALQRAGLYPTPPGASDLPGLEGSGRIAGVGPGVRGLAVGDEVTALFPGGAYAQFAVTAADHCLPIPDGMDLREAACLPETFFTVWSNLFMRAGLSGGEHLLVHGGSSGIGTTAIQLGRAFGARVFVTAGTPEKCAACLRLGAERAINHREEDFVAVMKAAGGADVILDMVGGPYVERNLAALADEGRLVQIAFLQGSKVELNLGQLMMRRLTLTGSTLRPQSDLAKTRIAEGLRAKVWPLLELGVVAPVMDSEFPLEEAAAAHARMEAGGHVGKIVLRVS